MTEDEAFKLLAVETLGGFGWTITAEEIPDLPTVDRVVGGLISWWNSLSPDTKDVIRELDLADGLWNKGWLTDWPALYTLLAGNPFGRFPETLQDIQMSLRNARDRAPDYAAQHAVGRLADDPALQGEQQ